MHFMRCWRVLCHAAPAAEPPVAPAEAPVPVVPDVSAPVRIRLFIAFDSLFYAIMGSMCVKCAFFLLKSGLLRLARLFRALSIGGRSCTPSSALFVYFQLISLSFADAPRVPVSCSQNRRGDVPSRHPRNAAHERARQPAC